MPSNTLFSYPPKPSNKSHSYPYHNHLNTLTIYCCRWRKTIYYVLKLLENVANYFFKCFFLPWIIVICAYCSYLILLIYIYFEEFYPLCLIWMHPRKEEDGFGKRDGKYMDSFLHNWKEIYRYKIIIHITNYKKYY